MSKRNKRKKQRAPTNGHTAQQSQPASQPQSPQPAESETMAREIEELHTKAVATATEQDVEAVESQSPPTSIDLTDTWRKAKEAEELFGKQTARAERAVADAQKLQDETKTERDEQKKARKEIGEELRRIETAQKQLEHKEEALIQEEEALQKQRIAAEAGFIAERRKALAAIEQQAEALKGELATHHKHMAEERVQFETGLSDLRATLDLDLQKRRGALQEEFDARQAELDEQRTAIGQKKADVKRKQRAILIEREVLDEDKAHLQERVQALAAQKIEELEFQLTSAEERLAQARADRNRLDEILASRQKAQEKVGEKSADDLAEEVASLKQECDRLRVELAERPSQDVLERLRQLEGERDSWERLRAKQLEDIVQLKSRLERTVIGVTELESLRDHNAALQSSRELLHAALEDLRKDVDERIRRADAKSPFPACTVIDSDKQYQMEAVLEEQIPDLKTFAEDLRNRIARSPGSGNMLYYSDRDVRSFLGGLAMSKLHLLQGISGTGKTSLPIAFAKAVGAGLTLVEIQAGWRDREDLIGHFNAFERRFYEGEFLQGLYKAQCPTFANRIYIILLDEMNLSHPEQYFADLLSALEQDEKRRRLTLMTAPVDPAPTWLVDGRILPIPPNVFFVGTANHDETTMDFAPKTYDRAHVMELPPIAQSFKPAEVTPRDPVAFSALTSAFSAAAERHHTKADQAYGFLTSELGQIMEKRFRVGWSNRLERQMQAYVPVVVEAGGSLGEAVDHILFSKILRKIRDRHENRPEDLVALRDKINSSWRKLDPKCGPTQSLKLLAREMHRLVGTSDEDDA